AHAADPRHDQAPVSLVRPDRRLLHVMVQPEALAPTLALESGPLNLRPASDAPDRLVMVLPGGICVHPRRLEGMGADGVPPRADSIDALPVVTLDRVQLLLNVGLARHLVHLSGAIERLALRNALGHQPPGVLLNLVIHWPLTGQRVVVRPSCGSGV